MTFNAIWSLSNLKWRYLLENNFGEGFISLEILVKFTVKLLRVSIVKQIQAPICEE